MKTLKTTAMLTALILSGCAVPPLPTETAEAPTSAPLAGKPALNAQARGLRTKIVERKQKIAVFEVMLTDVERRAAHAQIPLSYLPNTNLLAPDAPERAGNDRLSVTVRPTSAAAPAAKPVLKKRLTSKKRPRLK